MRADRDQPSTDLAATAARLLAPGLGSDQSNGRPRRTAPSAHCGPPRCTRVPHEDACTLTKIDWFRLVLVALRPGASLDEADQHGSIALQVLEGRVTVRVGDETIDVGEREVSVVAPGYPWTLVAVDNSLLRLHLAWPPVPGYSVTT